MIRNLITLAVGLAACYMTAHLISIPTRMIIPNKDYGVVV